MNDNELRVGGTIEGEQYMSAPIGSVARDEDSGEYVYLTTRGWASEHGFPDRLKMARTVVYLPDEAVS